MATAVQTPRMDVTARDDDVTRSPWLARLLDDVEQETAPRPEPPGQSAPAPGRTPRPFAYD